MTPVKHARTEVLDIAYVETGPAEGPAVVLLHGFPYDVHSYAEVAPRLGALGYRVVVPYLRGHGPTRFLDDATARSGQQAAIAGDVVGLLDALGIDEAVLGGYDWGGRAACIVAALHPERVTGLIAVNGYQIQDIGGAVKPVSPELEAGFWYFYYFLTERGRAGLTASRREIAEVIWRRNSPAWGFDRETLDRTAEAFDNPDYVDVVLHSYRHRLGFAPGAPEYAAVERVLAQQPTISVPTVTLAGLADGNFPAPATPADVDRFSGPRLHRRVSMAGHNLPQEAPDAFVQAVIDVTRLARQRRDAVQDAS